MVAEQVNGLRSINLCWSETVIDATPLEAWRAGFREGAKLIAWINQNRDNRDKVKQMWARFMTWALHPTEDNGKFVTMGVFDGFGAAVVYEPNALSRRINDYNWLKTKFAEITARRSEEWWDENLGQWQKAIHDEPPF